jgi:hypothetical protein
MKSRRHILGGGFLKHNSDKPSSIYFFGGRPYSQNDKKNHTQNVQNGTSLSILIEGYLNVFFEGYLNVFFIKQMSLFIWFVAENKFKPKDQIPY